MLAACHIVHLMGLDFLLLVLPCAGFLYLSQHKEEQVTRNPTQSHVQYDMLPTYFKNKYRLKVTLLGKNLLPDDGFIKKTETCWSFNIIMVYHLMF